ncbi:hypothetical protein E3N88_04714 [Mikania micrantha]|uniref:RING-type E3 ubiquitin transferase n=1 Tax=Mikania micrantha TaxID=192012 RepID=A0A5N6PX17_9ASTR|nr:hypothetical protein E3N88_04714 [Mikania micrantha]
MRLVVFRTNVPNNTNMRSRPTQPPQQQHSELTPNQQIKALKKLKKQIFNPTPKKIIKRLGRFYRQNDAAGNQKTDKKLEEDDDDDDKKCVVCLEYFEPKEAVMVTPCNHMFHEDCILPWIRSNGKCPVCRFSFCDDSGSSSTSDGNLVDDRLTNDVLSFVT